jgi:hypothetical protein
VFGASVRGGTLPAIQRVFIIMLENHAWSEILTNPSAPYLNNVLLPMASYCNHYCNVPNLHPSLPNYLWLEAGTNFGIFDDNDPIYDHQNTTNHLATLLNHAGISWKAYQENISPTNLPLVSSGYSCRHNPFVYFDDVTGTNDATYPYGLAHVRPYSELAGDLTNNTVARYNFIIPDDCNDMHTQCGTPSAVTAGDTWLSNQVPPILNSQAYRQGGALFIITDETDSADTNMAMIVLSPLARGGGYASTNYYTHSSTLRTLQEIFNIGPMLGDAANAADLSDLFVPAGLVITDLKNLGQGRFQITATGVATNAPLVLQGATDLVNWSPCGTNPAPNAIETMVVSNKAATVRSFYRLVQSLR